MRRRGDIACGRGFRGPAQDIQNRVLAGQASLQSQFTSHIDRFFPVLRDGGQNSRQLPVPALHGLKSLAYALQAWRQRPFTERTAIAQCAGFTLQHGQIGQWVTDGFVPSENALVFGNKL